MHYRTQKRRGQSGQVVPILAVSASVLIGLAALALDGGAAQDAQTASQVASDSAAETAAYQLGNGGGSGEGSATETATLVNAYLNGVKVKFGGATPQCSSGGVDYYYDAYGACPGGGAGWKYQVSIAIPPTTLIAGCANTAPFNCAQVRMQSKTVPFLAGVLGVSSITNNTAAVAKTSRGASNELVVWGSNNEGELGTGVVDGNPHLPQLLSIPGAGTIDRVAAGLGQDYALDSNGNVWAWGSNHDSAFDGSGALGCGACPDPQAPVKVLKGAQVSGDAYLGTTTPIIQVVTGVDSVFALDASGHVWSWGTNYGQGALGCGACGNQNTPIEVCAPTGCGAALSGVTMLATTTAGLGDDGTTVVAVTNQAGNPVYAWGGNKMGELGIGGTGDALAHSLPVQVKGSAATGTANLDGSTIRQIVGGYSAFWYVTTSGNVFAWGAASSDNPTDGGADGLGFAIPTIGNGAPSSGATEWSGTANCVGNGEDLHCWTTPVAMCAVVCATPCLSSAICADPLTGVSFLNARDDNVIAVTFGQAALAWGTNANGNDCLGDELPRNHATQMPAPLNANVNAVVSTEGISIVSLSNGDTYSCGSNAASEYEVSATSTNYAIQSNDSPVPTTTLSAVTAMAAGWLNGVAIEASGSNTQPADANAGGVLPNSLIGISGIGATHGTASTSSIAIGNYLNNGVDSGSSFSQILKTSWRNGVWDGSVLVCPSTICDQSTSYVPTAISCIGNNFCMAVGFSCNAGAAACEGGLRGDLTGVPFAVECLNTCDKSAATWCATSCSGTAGGWWLMSPAPPSASPAANYLTSVSCVSATFCVASGDYYSAAVPSPGLGGNHQNLIEKFDGGSWSVMAGVPNTGSDNILTGVSCATTGFCKAVGYSGNNAIAATVLNFNGVTWVFDSAYTGPPGHSSFLTGVSCGSDDFCMAIGYHCTTGHGNCPSSTSNYQMMAESWDTANPGTWTDTTPSDLTGNDRLTAVDCASATSCLAVGYSVDSSSLDSAVFQGWTPSGWASLPANGTCPGGTNLHLWAASQASNSGNGIGVGDCDKGGPAGIGYNDQHDDVEHSNGILQNFAETGGVSPGGVTLVS